MKNYKFITLFQTLSKEELSAFTKYINRLHAKEQVALNLFKGIVKMRPSLATDGKIEVAYLYRKCFKEKLGEDKAKRKKLLNGFSDLHLWLKEFLLQRKIKRESFEQNALWLSVLKERELELEFSKEIVSLKKEINKTPKKSLPDYVKNLIVDYIYYYHLVQENVPSDLNILQKCIDDLDQCYSLGKVKLLCEMTNLKNMFSYQIDFDSIGSEKEKSITEAEHPLNIIYEKVYQLIANNKVEFFFEIEEILLKSGGRIAKGEIHIIISYLHNYAASQIRLGKEEFWTRMHQLNKIGLSHNIFTKKGVMSPTQFNNIASIGAREEDFDWVHYFIKTQSQFLPDGIREETVLLGKASLLFEQKEFKKALKKVEKIKPSDLRQSIRLRAFIIRCQFEIMEDGETVYDHCIAFESFLRRNRKPKKEMVEATLNAIHVIKLLIRKKSKKGLLLEKVNSASTIYFKGWLLEKVEEYKAEFATRQQS